MKKIRILVVMIAVFITSISSQHVKAQVSVSFQFFYDNLSAYGSWMSYPRYGYVFRPRVERSFHPYRTRGHWVWSDDYGWIWVSGYSWGWACFHYGRWHYDPYYGWLWIPDYSWAPAWVAWRGGGDYYGWAPLDAGINISISFGSYSPPNDYWCFAPRQYITSPVIYNYVVSPQQNITIIRNTTIINNYSTNGGPTRNVFVTGPRKTEVEQYTHQNIKSVKLSESTRPGAPSERGNVLAMYKPRVNTDKGSAKPSKVITAENAGKGNAPKEQTKTQPVRTEQPQRKEMKHQPAQKEIRNEPKEQRNQPVFNQPQRNQPERSQQQKMEQHGNPFKNQTPPQQQRMEQPRNQQPGNQPMKMPQQQQQQHQQPKGPPPKKKNG